MEANTKKDNLIKTQTNNVFPKEVIRLINLVYVNAIFYTLVDLCVILFYDYPFSITVLMYVCILLYLTYGLKKARNWSRIIIAIILFLSLAKTIITSAKFLYYAPEFFGFCNYYGTCPPFSLFLLILFCDPIILIVNLIILYYLIFNKTIREFFRKKN